MRARWWRLLAIPMGALLLVAGCSGGEARRAPRAAAPTLAPGSPPARTGGPLLGATWSDNPTALKLGRLDPRSLAPLPGPGLKLDGNWTVAAVAPDRSTAVLADQESGRLVLVDLDRMRQVGTLDVPAGGWPAGSRWVGPSRVLLAWAGVNGGATNDVLLLDAAAGRFRLLRQQRVDGAVLTAARSAGGMVLLVAPVGSIGPARVVVVDGDARIRTVTLSGLAAGNEQVDSGGSDPRARQALAGLAVDPVGARAFVVAASTPVAEVDLGSLRVGYHRLGRPGSLLQRLARWLVPPAEAKEVSGPARSAVWLGDGLLGVTGSDASFGGGNSYRERPSGLQLIDTSSWTERMVEPHATSATFAAGRLLTYGVSFGERNQGYGLTVFGPGNRQPVHLLGARQVVWVVAAGSLAYVQLSDDQGSGGYAVVDLRADRVLREAPGDMPQLLVPDQP
ncbi:MAG TPA: hypothetical protein VF486_24115 [Actinomycetes bacterium]